MIHNLTQDMITTFEHFLFLSDKHIAIWKYLVKVVKVFTFQMEVLLSCMEIKRITEEQSSLF